MKKRTIIIGAAVGLVVIISLAVYASSKATSAKEERKLTVSEARQVRKTCKLNCRGIAPWNGKKKQRCLETCIQREEERIIQSKKSNWDKFLDKILFS